MAVFLPPILTHLRKPVLRKARPLEGRREHRKEGKMIPEVLSGEQGSSFQSAQQTPSSVSPAVGMNHCKPQIPSVRLCVCQSVRQPGPGNLKLQIEEVL